MQVLVLDVSFQPLGTISWQRAITLYFQNKVEILQEYTNEWIHSVNLTIKVPSIIRFIKNVIKKARKVKFSRENIFNRDRAICQYCGEKVSRNDFTLDHVYPRSQGGTTCFENICVCCVDCNRKKANRTPEQAGMKLKVVPIRPKNIFQLFKWQDTMPQEWRSFCYWFQELDNDE